MKLVPRPRMLSAAILSLGLSLTLVSAGATAEVKIGTIDLKKVFDDYYKTKLADASIKDEASGLEKELKAFTEDHDKAVGDYKKALDEANDQAVSAKEREQRKKEAEGKLIKVNDLRQTIEQFNRSARNNLDEKLRRTRDNIVKEIQAIVSNKAKTSGYSLVLDTSTADAGGRPSMVIYSNGDNDLTATVIAQLNATAPPDLPLGNDKRDKDKDKPEEKKNDRKDKKDEKK